MRALLVTADDLGYSRVRDDGLLRAAREGLVRRASLLVNGASADYAARGAPPTLRLGLHLNVTEGRPLAAPLAMQGPQALFEALDAGLVPVEDLRAEVEAQLDRFEEIVGRPPCYVDGHNHAHVHPVVCKVLAEAMQRRGLVETRVPLERWLPRAFLEALSAPKRAFYKRIVRDAAAAAPVFAACGVRPCATAFVGISLMGSRLTLQNLTEALLALPSDCASCELMTHPGLRCSAEADQGCGAGADAFSQSPEREAELEFLCDARTREHLETTLGFAAQAVAPATAEPVGQRRAALVGSLTLATGNLVTMMRLAKGLQAAAGTPTVLLSAPAVGEDFETVLDDLGVETVLAMNARRAAPAVAGLDRSRRRLVVIIGGTDVNGLEAKSPEERRSVLEVFAGADAAVAFSEALRLRLETLLRADDMAANCRVWVIPQSLEPPPPVAPAPLGLRARCGIRGDDLLLLLPSGLRPVKDPCFLFDALEAWGGEKDGPRVALVVVGPRLSGALSAQVAARCQTLDLSMPPSPSPPATPPGKLFYLPPLSRSALLGAMQHEADAVLNTSISEGMSNAVLEAMSLGVPVFARRNEGNATLISHGVTGWLFETPSECVEQLRALAADRTQAQIVAKAAAAHIAASFSREAERSALAALMQSLPTAFNQ